MLTKTIDIQAAQSRFAELMSSVMEGTEIILTRDGMPVVRMTAILPRLRAPGLAAVVAREDAAESAPDDAWLGKQY
jgi:prevent-host-death family protein